MTYWLTDFQIRYFRLPLSLILKPAIDCEIASKSRNGYNVKIP